MTQPQNDLTIRSITGAGELDLFCALTYTVDDELPDDLAAGRRRPAWMWVALRGEHLVARAAWWGSDDDAAPSLLDILDVADDPDRIDVAVRLLTGALSEIIPAGARPPEYSRFIPPDWREHASSRRAVEDRMAIAGQIGAQLLTERFRFEWRPGTPVAAPTGRIEFRPLSDDGELLDLMTLTMDGTLDAHSRQDLAPLAARQAAGRHFEDWRSGYGKPRYGIWRKNSPATAARGNGGSSRHSAAASPPASGPPPATSPTPSSPT